MTNHDSGALAGLQEISLDDLPRYKAAINQTNQIGWQHYFPYLYFLGQSNSIKILIEENAGSICIYRLRKQGDSTDLCLFLLPMPFQADVLEHCLKRVWDYNGTQRASIFRVDAKDVDLFRGRPNTRIVSCPEEYIYAPAHFKDLSGSKNGNLRRNVQKFQRHDDVEVLPYGVQYRNECLSVLDRWIVLQKDKYESASRRGYTLNCLKLYEFFPRHDLFGKVVRIGGKVLSFGFAGEIRTGMGDMFITYSDHRINGLHKYLEYCLFLEMEDHEFVNSATADTPGLIAAKQALCPVALHPLYQVYAGRLS